MSLENSDYRSLDWTNYPLHSLNFRTYVRGGSNKVTLITVTQFNDGAVTSKLVTPSRYSIGAVPHNLGHYSGR
jgi:hypothetical protein